MLGRSVLGWMAVLAVDVLVILAGYRRAGIWGAV